MKIEVKSIEFDTDGQEIPGLVRAGNYTADVGEEEAEGLVVNYLERETGWLVKSFNYRLDDGRWERYHDDMSWRKGIAGMMGAGGEV